MKKTGIIMGLILLFSFLQVIWIPTFEVNAQSALSGPTIVSPQKKTYNSKFLTLNVTYSYIFASIESFSCSIDGLGSCGSSKVAYSEDTTIIHGTIIRTATLPELAEGAHAITVCLEGTLYFPEERHYSEQATVYFTIDTTPPSISSSSVENKTYNQLDLPLNFTVNEPTSWMGYSLDNEANRTLTENTTLTLKEGTHSITLYANDTVGNMIASETIFFTRIQETLSEPFLIILAVTASGVAATIIVVGLLVYLKRRKH